jgi:hypothetical protein
MTKNDGPKQGHVTGRVMAQALSCRPLTAEARVRPRRICGGQNGTETVFFSELFGFPQIYVRMESHGGMIFDRRNPKNSEKNLSQCHFIHHKFHMD